MLTWKATSRQFTKAPVGNALNVISNLLRQLSYKHMREFVTEELTQMQAMQYKKVLIFKIFDSGKLDKNYFYY